jgi:putative ABC transport system ATP-binding protein
MNTARTHRPAPADATRPAATSGTEAANIAPLRVRGLTKTYGDGATEVRAVDAVDLDVRAGEVLLVMGPSGSGKTTLLLMLGALLRPTTGSILVTDRAGVSIDIATAAERVLPALRAHSFGFIFQDYALLDALTATENIAVAANIAGLTGAPAHARAAELLERVGLTHRATARPSQMSGGEQQRVALARALANDPPVLLADEPTANLDASRGRDLARLLRTLADEDHRSVVIVSHDERLREVADRVLWMEDGAFREVAAMVVDPVCGMAVEPTGPSLERLGRTVWFCSDGCQREYADDPDRFATPHPPTTESGVANIPPGGIIES